MTLTKEEIHQIQFELRNYSYDVPFCDGYRLAATKYLLQLKEERERAWKLMEALGLAKQYFDDRADCDYQGDPLEPIPNYEMIMLSEIKTAINEYNNTRS